MRRLLLACMTVAAISWLSLEASDEPANQEALKKIGEQIKADLAAQEQVLGGRFRDFELNLLKLKQVMERSDKQEDKDKAVVLGKALEEAKRLGISAKFDQLVETINKSKFTKPSEVADILQDSRNLADKIKIVMAILGEDSRSLRLAEERRSLEELLKQLEKVIHDQKIVQQRTERGLAKPSDQAKVTDATAKLANSMDKNGQGNEAKNNKGNAKPGDTKPGEKNAKAKEQGKTGDTQKGQSKEGGKQGDPKSGKPGEAKPAGDPKSGDPKSGDPKSGDPKAGKPGEAKPGKGSEAKGGDAKPSKSGGDPKSGQAKPGQQGSENKKPGEAKEGGKEDKTPGVKEKQKAEAKGGPADKKVDDGKKDPKAGEAKPGPKGDPKGAGAKESKAGQQSKPADSKPGESKAGDSKPGEAKPGKSSQGQGQPKPGQQGQQAQEKNDPKAPPQQPQSNKEQQQIGKKQIEDAKYPQEEAEKKIPKDPKAAAEDQQKAIDSLEEAKKKLEKLLAQIREEELERLLANLQRMCIKMRDMQIAVLNGTKETFKGIQARTDKLPDKFHKAAALKLSEDSETGEKAIVAEADKALMVLESEGSAVAFPEVFKQVREDMVNVQRRLGIVDVSPFTQNMEQDIIDTLQEMIDALKKAQKDMKDKKESKAKKDDQPKQPQDQKLLEKIAELKMIKSMQIRVNKRTTEYGREYSGEQAADPRIQGELRALSQRQVRIYEATNRIAKGDNK